MPPLPPSTAPTCIISGARGFLGGRILQRFACEGWNAIPMTRKASPEDGSIIPFTLGETVSPESLKGAKALVHCAYDFTLVRKEDIWRTNVEGSRKLFAAAKEAGVEKIILISTISAFEGCKSLYGKAKLEIEKIAKEHGATILRPGLIYGEGSGGMFGQLVKQAGNSKLIPLIGDGSQIQYLVHEEDLSDFIFRIANGEIAPLSAPVTAAHEEKWPFRRILETIATAKGKRPIFVNLPWRLMWAGFRFGEALRLPLPFRSDSIVSLVNQNPHPDFSPNEGIGLHCRPFSMPGSVTRVS